MKKILPEIKRTLGLGKWVLSIYFKNYPLMISVTIVTHMISALSGLINAYIVALATDQAIHVLEIKATDIYSFLPIVFMIIGSYLFFQFIDIINTYFFVFRKFSCVASIAKSIRCSSAQYDSF